MRLALVSQEYPPETAHGGIGSQTFQKAHGLAALGHDVLVVSRSTDGRMHEYRDDAVTVIRVPDLAGSPPGHTEPVRWLSYSLAVAGAVAALHARSPLDVVDFPEWASEGFVHLLNRTEWSRIPTVVQLHGPLVMFAHTVGWPEIASEFYRVGTMMEGTCLRLADAIFSSSRCSADWCARHYGLAGEHIPVLHTGIDTRLFRPIAGPKEGRPTIIFVGNIAANKGVESLLDAALQLVGDWPELQLRMLGRGESGYCERLRAKARAAGRPDLLDLVGFVPREELPRHLCRAHVFAAPSIYEPGPGLVNLEAMACGLPVVASAGSGAAEVVTPGENGLLVRPGSLEDLVQALAHLLRSPGEREALAERGRCYVLAEADSRVCLGRLEAFYAEVVRGGRTAPPAEAGGHAG